MNIYLGAYTKFLHLRIRKCHILPPKAKTPATTKRGRGGGNKVHLPKICHIYVVMMKVDTVIPAKENPKKGLEKGLKLKVKKFLGLFLRL